MNKSPETDTFEAAAEKLKAKRAEFEKEVRVKIDSVRKGTQKKFETL